MTLFLNNDDVKRVLTMDVTIQALESSYKRMITGEGVCRPRVDIQIPTADPQKTYRWGTMEGGCAEGYFAIRMKSDIAYESRYGDSVTLEKYCIQPGTFCGLIFLFRVNNGEPLAILNDGHLQHMRVGADSALGVRYMANEAAKTVGMFGSGGMARSHIESFRLVRKIEKIKVYSPTRKNRETYAREMEEKYGIKTMALDDPREVYKDVDILCSCTDASVPVIQGRHLEKGTHITSIGGRPDRETFDRVDRFLRLGNATPPYGQSEAPVDEFFRYITPKMQDGIKREHSHAGGVVRQVPQERVLYLKDLLEGQKGRLTPDDITYSERGNLQGAQFYAVAGKVYELAKEKGLGREIPTEWFLQDIRD